jgi:hypothetical protein
MQIDKMKFLLITETHNNHFIKQLNFPMYLQAHMFMQYFLIFKKFHFNFKE